MTAPRRKHPSPEAQARADALARRNLYSTGAPRAVFHPKPVREVPDDPGPNAAERGKRVRKRLAKYRKLGLERPRKSGQGYATPPQTAQALPEQPERTQTELGEVHEDAPLEREGRAPLGSPARPRTLTNMSMDMDVHATLSGIAALATDGTVHAWGEWLEGFPTEEAPYPDDWPGTYDHPYSPSGITCVTGLCNGSQESTAFIDSRGRVWTTDPNHLDMRYVFGPSSHPILENTQMGEESLPDGSTPTVDAGPVMLDFEDLGGGPVVRGLTGRDCLVFQTDDGRWWGVGENDALVIPATSADPNTGGSWKSTRECDLFPEGVEFERVGAGDWLGVDSTAWGLTADGDLYTWGSGGETSFLGRGPAPGGSNYSWFATPTQVTLPGAVADVAMSTESGHMLCCLEGGDVYGWGWARLSTLGFTKAEATTIANANGWVEPGSGLPHWFWDVPVELNITGAEKVGVAGWRSYVVKTDGSVWSCGAATGAQDGYPDYSLGYASGEHNANTTWNYTSFDHIYVQETFRQITDPLIDDETILKITGTRNSTHMLRVDGKVISMGIDAYGQLGQAAGIPSSDFSNTHPASGEKPLETRMGFEIEPIGGTHIDATGYGALAGSTNSIAYGWGRNEWGEALTGDTDVKKFASDTTEEPSSLVQYTCGKEFVSFLRSDGTVWHLGRNGEGVYGNNISEDDDPDYWEYDNPTQTSGLTGVAEIAAGHAHILARKTGGSVWAWGAAGDGQLGTGMAPGNDNEVPEAANITGVAQIWAGHNTSYAKTTGGDFYYWGSPVPVLDSTAPAQDEWLLGQRFDPTRAQDEMLPSLGNVIDADGGEKHTLVLRSDGTVMAWGFDDFGQVGTDGNGYKVGGFAFEVAEPYNLGISGIAQVACGDWHSAALKTDGTVLAWGANDQGQVGSGDFFNYGSPNQVVGGEQGGEFLINVAQIACGEETTYARTTDNFIYAWGTGGGGQLGNGKTGSSPEPVLVGAMGEIEEFTLQRGAEMCPVPGEDPEAPGVEEPDWPNIPPDTPLPPMDPWGPIDTPYFNGDIGIDHPPGFDFGFPEMPPFDPDFGFPDVEFPDFDFDFPIDDFEFPDFSFDPCFDFDLGDFGNCGSEPGTGGGIGPQDPDGTIPPGTGNGGGTGPSGDTGTFPEETCYTAANAWDVIVELAAMLELNADQLVDQSDCLDAEAITKCFPKGSEIFDAIWWVADQCDAQPVDPGDGTIIITPIVPNDVLHTVHEDGEAPHAPIFSLERQYDAAEMYFAVEVYKIEPDGSGGFTEVWSKVAIVPGPFSAEPNSIYRIVAPETMTEDAAQALAIKRAQEFGRMSYRVTCTTLFDLKYKLLDKLQVLRPSLDPPLDHTLMITNIVHDISEQGKYTILEARFFDLDLIGGDPVEDFINVADGSAWEAETSANQTYFGQQFTADGFAEITGVRVRYTVAGKIYRLFLREAANVANVYQQIQFTGTGAAMDVELNNPQLLQPGRSYEVGYGSWDVDGPGGLDTGGPEAMRYAIAGFGADTELFNLTNSYYSTSAAGDGVSSRTLDNTKRPPIGIYFQSNVVDI